MKTLPDTRYIFSLVILALMGITFQINAQTSCAEKLEIAQSLYNEGKIHLVEETISECLEDGFTKEEKIEAYKLLSITYTYLEDGEKAENAVLNLLKFDKEYTVNPDLDPTEFIKLYDKFRTFPILKVGVKAVGNINFFSISETRSISVNPEGNIGVMESLIGYGGGIDVEIPYEDYLEIVPGIYFASKSFTVTTDLDAGTVNNLLGTNSYTEQQSWIELPVLVRYKYMKHRIHPYGEIGFSLGYLVTANKTSLNTDRTTGAPVEGPEISFIDSRNQFNYSISAGAGIKLDIPMAEIIIGGRFNYSLNDQIVISSEQTPEENDLLYEYGVIDPTYKMHTFSFFIGYMRKIYKPKLIYE